MGRIPGSSFFGPVYNRSGKYIGFRKRCSKEGEWKIVKDESVLFCPDCGMKLRYRSHHSKAALLRQQILHRKQMLEYEEYQKKKVGQTALITSYL